MTFSIAKLNNQKVILRFCTAIADDEAILKSLLPEGEITNISQIPQTIPSYLITIIPELGVNGNLVHSGLPITLGANQNFNFSIYAPNFGSKPYSSPVVAGSYLGIVVIGGSLSIEMMKDSTTTARAHKTAGNHRAIQLLLNLQHWD